MNKRMVAEIQSSNGDDKSEMVRQLREKCEENSTRNEKLQMLTVLPKNRKVQDEFVASNYKVRKAKDLVTKKGILSTPNP